MAMAILRTAVLFVWLALASANDIDHCASNPCVHGRCVDGVDSDYHCECEPGWTTRDCNTDVSHARYMGCYLYDGATNFVDQHITTIDECLDYCTDHLNTEYAAVKVGSTYVRHTDPGGDHQHGHNCRQNRVDKFKDNVQCYCIGELPTESSVGCYNNDLKTCGKDGNEVCGSDNAASVFKSNLASLTNPDECPPGMQGTACNDPCPAGKYGPNCKYGCPVNCPQYCDSRLGYCTEACNAGYGPFCLNSEPDCPAKTMDSPCPFCLQCPDSVCEGKGDSCYYNCPKDWTGSCQATDPCENVQCVHGTCDAGTCKCDAGWTGANCDIDACDPDPCMYGTCVDGNCECEAGYTGSYCDKSACDSNTCGVHGKCVNEACECTPGWTESSCNTMSGETFDCEDNRPCAYEDEFDDFHFPYHDRTKYVRCYRQDCVIMDCPGTLVFDDIINNCNYP